MTDSWFLLHLIKQHQPITRKKLFQLSGLSHSQFRAAWHEVKPHVWTVQGKPPVLELRTETAKL
jgi:hypothetical protein